MSNRLRKVMARADRWPEEARPEALERLRRIEEDFVVSLITQTELEQAHQEALVGRGISLQKITEKYAGLCELSPEDCDALERSEEDARLGRFASDDQVSKVLGQHSHGGGR